MEILKNRGFVYAEYTIDFLSRYIDRQDIYCSVNALNNCREQGYILTILKNYGNSWDDGECDGLTFYVYNNRWSDEPTITWKLKASYDKMYNDEDWEKRTKTFEHIEDLVNFVGKLIEDNLKEAENNEN